jgi:guanylate kinase
MLVVSSPSGAGKTSLCRRLIVDHPDLELSVSWTTREPRRGEQDGREYHFVSRESFDAEIERKGFLEWADVHDNRYGSPLPPVRGALDRGHDILFDIDWQGAARIARKAPEDVVRVFILPPSLRELKRRLEARAQDHPDVIERRVARAKDEMSHWREYDYVMVNDDFDRTYAELAHVYHAERQRQPRNPGLERVVGRLMDEAV